MNDLFLEAGRRIPLGKKINSGGEGEVYEVPAIGNDFAAKIYHKPLTLEKQDKLRAMVLRSDEGLKNIAAWPIATLHQHAYGPIKGFVMPKLVGYRPIHELYGPVHRKQFFPHADWAFLINAARNVAAAFETIHYHGHIIGDVNQGNIFVAANSTVKLIDCDSFQIAVTGKHHLCDVGVGNFIPPELQGRSLHAMQRTQNHDNFGLAILIFYLLMMGRHPFAGVYQGHGEDSIEKAIQEFRFAYGQNAKNKGMSPPPNTLPLSILPYTLSALFEGAFSEFGIKAETRPSAKMWLQCLDSLKGQLRTCRQEPMHKYFGDLGNCPWCSLESRAAINFFIPKTTGSQSPNNFNLGQVWARIMAIGSPGPAPQIDPASIHMTPKPIPDDLRGLFGFFKFERHKEERQRRQTALNIAQQNYNAINKVWRDEAGDVKFQRLLEELTHHRKEYASLDTSYSQEYQKLKTTIEIRQMTRFLNKFFISDHKIPKIGPTRKATLASFGIETAADISKHKITMLPGFGESYTRELLKWQAAIIKGFVFDPNKGIDPLDTADLNRRFALKQQQLEANLSAGIEKLKQVRNQALQQRQQIESAVIIAARELAQATADLKALG
jgi:DNA-binding helix-hairpin-helix protein with protein kinase domain